MQGSIPPIGYRKVEPYISAGILQFTFSPYVPYNVHMYCTIFKRISTFHLFFSLLLLSAFHFTIGFKKKIEFNPDLHHCYLTWLIILT